ncbi:MAG: SDR family oxidoreductase [Acidobacteria bacterium]|nr:SDR family oxidoreductase [Acidobacteriota bacterium]MBI3423395.1 SDR family oxidoreductase [Acidobacteriota bacterium]
MNFETLFRLDNRTAVVIGAGSGIGQAGAQALAAQGAFVYCADNRLEAAQTTVQTLPQGTALAVNVTDAVSVRALFATVLAERGQLDAVVTTPAINVRKPLLEYTDDEFDRVINVNLKGTLIVFREAGRLMAAQGSGSLLAISSIRSQVVEPGQGVYAATKAGIVQLVRALAAELGPRGVRVNAIAPGVVETPLTAPIKNNPDWYGAYAAKSVFNRWARPDEMAGAIVYLSSDAASYVTGSVLFVDGGWTAADGRFAPPL